MNNPSEPLRTDRRRLLAAGAGLGASLSAGLSAGLFAPGCAAHGPASSAVDAAAHADETARADERFADLTDQRATVAPITGADRAARRTRLARLLAARGVDAFVCEGGATLTYLTGVAWGRSERLFALVVTADGASFWLVPAFEAARAELAIRGADGPGGALVTWQEDEYATRPWLAALRARRVERLAVDPAFRFGFVAELAVAARAEAHALAAPGAIDAGRALLAELRGRKEPKELAILRRANELTQRVLARVAEEVRPGLTGEEIGALVARAHTRLGFSSSWNLPLVGAAAALPHGDASAKPLANGDVLLVDCGGSFQGYQSDITRTWVPAGAPSAAVERAWSAVRDAQRRAADAIRPGRRCREIDAVARAALVQRGYPGGYAAFTHRLGHGIGLEGHEDPYFDGASDVELASGMTLSNEPGLYFPGEFGVRIEDVVAVTDTGCESFGAGQPSPRTPA